MKDVANMIVNKAIAMGADPAQSKELLEFVGQGIKDAVAELRAHERKEMEPVPPLTEDWALEEAIGNLQVLNEISQMEKVLQIRTQVIEKISLWSGRHPVPEHIRVTGIALNPYTPMLTRTGYAKRFFERLGSTSSERRIAYYDVASSKVEYFETSNCALVRDILNLSSVVSRDFSTSLAHATAAILSGVPPVCPIASFCYGPPTGEKIPGVSLFVRSPLKSEELPKIFAALNQALGKVRAKRMSPRVLRRVVAQKSKSEASRVAFSRLDVGVLQERAIELTLAKDEAQLRFKADDLRGRYDPSRLQSTREALGDKYSKFKRKKMAACVALYDEILRESTPSSSYRAATALNWRAMSDSSCWERVWEKVMTISMPMAMELGRQALETDDELLFEKALEMWPMARKLIVGDWKLEARYLAELLEGMDRVAEVIGPEMQALVFGFLDSNKGSLFSSGGDVAD